MATNIIALIFPEYNDKGNPTTSGDWVTNKLYDDKTFGEQIKERISISSQFPSGVLPFKSKTIAYCFEWSKRLA